MKRVITGVCIFSLALLINIAPASALNKKNTGCGLGYMLFRDASDSLVVQTIAVSLNISATQPLSITTGTAGCQPPRKLVGDPRLNEFVAANMDSLASDIAAGQGETLETLAELMAVPSPTRVEFYSKLQGDFEKIFTHPGIQSAGVIDNIVKIVG